jgi:hypothetical protein
LSAAPQNPWRAGFNKNYPKKGVKENPQVGFVIQALSDALLGGNFG